MEKVFKKLTVFLSGLLVITTVFLIFVIPTYIKSERKIDFFSSNQIVDNVRNMEINMTSVIYIQNEKGGWEEYQRLHGTENRIWVGIDKVPQYLKDAFISIEDERFESHSGVDWKRTAAAVGNKLLKFDSSEFGGSTITQQLIKNVTNDKGRNVMRKFREIVRALLIERKLNKTEILEAYLNTIALGNGICGVQVASNYYFNKDVSELTLTECAALAAITKNPTEYNPVSGAEANTERRRTVLDKMLELGKITYEEYDQAYNTPLVLDDSREDDLEIEINSYFVDALIDQVIGDLAEKYNLNTSMASTMFYNGGFKIYATVKPEIQSKMEEVYTDIDTYFSQTKKNDNGETVHVQSAMTVMDYSGHIVGIVGGAGEKTTNRGLNRATDSPRQPGSTMKPIGVYALAIDRDIVNYTSSVLDQPIKNYYEGGKSGPKEWYGYYKGTVSLNYAIRKSMNTIPVRLLQEIGIETSYDFLVNKLHCEHLVEADKNLSALALGGTNYGLTTTESAAAFAIFGNQGVYHKPTTYYKVERPNGEIVLEYDDTGEQVIGRDSATIMNHLLEEVVYGSEGTGRSIAGYSSMKAYAKTGTSSESNDLWMVAGTPYYIGSVWYGFDLQSKVNSGGAAKIWKEVMRDVHKDLEKKEFEDSENVVKKGIGYYKKNGRMDNPIYQSSSSSESSSVVSSEAITDNSSVASDTSSQQTPSAPAESTVTEPTTPSESSNVTVSSQPDESAASSKPTESSKPAEPSAPSSSAVASSSEAEDTQ
ncbi:MAG: transglycosylase domain-containing protein [Acutalibacteraceae bacterium]|nr:transglycosylase domain-containing protein [Acutalibacteraceae bacterium]